WASRTVVSDQERLLQESADTRDGGESQETGRWAQLRIGQIDRKSHVHGQRLQGPVLYQHAAFVNPGRQPALIGDDRQARRSAGGNETGAQPRRTRSAGRSTVDFDG